MERQFRKFWSDFGFKLKDSVAPSLKQFVWVSKYHDWCERCGRHGKKDFENIVMLKFFAVTTSFYQQQNILYVIMLAPTEIASVVFAAKVSHF